MDEFPDDWDDDGEAGAAIEPEAEADGDTGMEAEAEAQGEAEAQDEAEFEAEAEACADNEADDEDGGTPGGDLPDEEAAAASEEEDVDVEALEAAALEALNAVEEEGEEAADDHLAEDADMPDGSPGEEDDDDDDDLEALEAAALASFADMPGEGVATLPLAKKPGVAKQPAVAKQPIGGYNRPAVGKGNPIGKGPAVGQGPAKGKGPVSAKGGAAPWLADGRSAGKSNKGKSAPGKGLGGAKPQGKGQKPASEPSVGRRVVDLNKSGVWKPGQGIDTRALASLRELPDRQAHEIITDLEGMGASVRNPSNYIQVAVTKARKNSDVEGKTAGAPWRSASDGQGGMKRPAPATGPPSKRVATTVALQEAPADEATAEEEAEEEKLLSKLPASMLQKVKVLRKRMQLKAPALKSLANHEQRDGLIVLQALAMRDKVEDPTKFVVASLRKKDEMRQGKGGAGVKVANKPVAKAPAGGGPPAIDRGGGPKPPQGPPPGAQAAKPAIPKTPGVAKPQIAKAPGGKPAAAKPAVAKAGKPGVPAKPSGVGKPPQLRSDLDFEQMAVQGKLQALNKLDIWPGPHPLDDAALTALLGISPGRALEILDDAEEKGTELKNPSSFVMQTAKKDPR